MHNCLESCHRDDTAGLVRLCLYSNRNKTYSLTVSGVSSWDAAKKHRADGCDTLPFTVQYLHSQLNKTGHWNSVHFYFIHVERYDSHTKPCYDTGAFSFTVMKKTLNMLSQNAQTCSVLLMACFIWHWLAAFRKLLQFNSRPKWSNRQSGRFLCIIPCRDEPCSTPVPPWSHIEKGIQILTLHCRLCIFNSDFS